LGWEPPERILYRAENLDRIETALRLSEKGKVTEAAAALRGMTPLALDAALERPARGLQGLSELQSALGSRPWRTRPHVEYLKLCLKDVLGATGDATLVSRLREALAAKCTREGYRPQADALRDIKRVDPARGGTGPTAKAGQGIPAGSGGPIPPPGGAQGTHPPINEPPDLPPIATGEGSGGEDGDAKRIDAAMKKLRPELEAEWRKGRAELGQSVTAYLQEVKVTPVPPPVIPAPNRSGLGTTPVKVAPADDTQDEAFIKEVEKILGPPPLTPAERAFALRLKGKLAKPARVAALLKAARASGQVKG
jgi:hypothetical protein